MQKTIKFLFIGFTIFAFFQTSFAQDKEKEKERKDLKLNLDENGKHFVQFTFLNQIWARFNQSNPGTTVESEAKDNTFDIGLRRTRFQIIGQLTDRIVFYAQLGMNNFNAQFNSNGGNRKQAFFVHDALCEYKLTKENQLKLGGGLTIVNGLSRFSQPSIGSIMTLDVPIFAQTTVDQTDEFSRKLSLYARGQVGKFDYRVAVSDPFPITSTGSPTPALSSFANFASMKHNKQYQAYLMWQFFDVEPHTTPYMTGTYLGTKKVFNIGIGAIHQNNALWHLDTANDTVFQNMSHLAVESYLDMPLNKQKGTAISVYLGYFNLNYGTNYLRYNGIMNPANGLASGYTDGIKGQGATYGNAFPMFGTGQTIYGQFGYLLPAKNLTGIRFMPFVSTTFSKYSRLQDHSTLIADLGMNMFLNGAKNKISLDWQNRPTYTDTNNTVSSGARKNSITFQYQIFF